MRVGPATNVARINVTETITALWAFAHASGISLDDIIERTADAGVTIDGVLVKDIALWLQGFAAAGTAALSTNVIGDSVDRFALTAGGIISWGDGALARDTNLYRDAANILKTDDSLEVAGVLGLVIDDITERTPTLGVMVDGVLLKDGGITLADDLEFARVNTGLAAGDNHDVATGTVTVQRFTPTAAGSVVTGFAGGRDGRFLVVVNVNAAAVDITIKHQNAGSVNTNRIITPNQADFVLTLGESCLLYYDGVESRWHVIQGGI